jgi:hypothetical protein
MRAPISPDAARGRRPWLIPVVLSIVILGVAGYLLARRMAEPEPDPKTVPVLAGRKGPTYKSRAHWSQGRGGAPATTSIHGTVYDADGQPIAGARLHASTFQISGNRSTPAATADSRADGRFDLRVPDGSYYLTAEREGYGAAMAIANGGEEVSVVLPRRSVVSGHVRGEDGQPITRFVVDVLSPATDDMAAPPPFASRRFDSADGSFEISDFPDRSAYLRVSAQGRASALSEMLRLRPGEQKKQDFTLTAGCSMTGVVKDGSGAPVAGVLVDAELRRSAGAMGTLSIDATSSDESDAMGRFTLEGVPMGDLMIRAYDGTHAVTTTTASLESCADVTPIELTMSAGGMLHGVARDTTGKPVPGAKITLSHRAIGFVNTTTDAEGHYRFDKLPAGGMRVQAIRGEQHTTAFVTIPEGETVEKELLFSSGGQGEIRGQVTAGTKPLAGIALTVIANEGNGVLGSRHPVTGADGTYRVTGLPDGAYAILVSSVNKMASAQLEGGKMATVDIDISQVREPMTPQQVQELREKMNEAKAEAARAKAEAEAEAEKAQEQEAPEQP